MRPVLIATSGLPVSGKSTVAYGLAKELGIPVLSVDPIEAAMWQGGMSELDTGKAAYLVAASMAAENLRLGLSVVIDAVNPVQEARNIWIQMAADHNAAFLPIECICSDPERHRQRVEARVRKIPGMPEVTWEQVQERKAEYVPWAGQRLVLDSAGNEPGEILRTALEAVMARL